MLFAPKLETLPSEQRTLWPELAATPDSFTLYGGTGLALRLGHRTSVDFDFFSNAPFDPEHLAGQIPYLQDAERIQFAPAEEAEETLLHVASLLDLAGTKAAVIQKRAEVKDYLDIHALLQHGIELSTILAAGTVIYGRKFNPVITLKALCFFEDVPALPMAVRTMLTHAVESVDVTNLPVLTPYDRSPSEKDMRLWNFYRKHRSFWPSLSGWSGFSRPAKHFASRFISWPM